MKLKKFFKSSTTHFLDLPTGAFSAQLALRFLLAFFPAVLVTVTVLGYWLDVRQVIPQIATSLYDVLPTAALELLIDNVQAVLQDSSLTIFSVGFLALVYSVSSLIKDLFGILNQIYETEKKRSFWKQIVLALLLIVGGLLIGAMILQGLFFTESLLQFVSSVTGNVYTFNWLIWRWPLMAGVIFLFVYFSYVFIPFLPKHYWRWNLPGAVLFTIGWFAMSLLFNFYVSNFADYNQTYGVLGAIILLLFYLQLVSNLYIIGAVINSRVIHQEEKSLWGRMRTLWQRYF